MYLTFCYSICYINLLCLCCKWCHNNVKGRGIGDAPGMKKILVQHNYKENFITWSTFYAKYRKVPTGHDPVMINDLL